ncbi:MAG: precorrin-2 C(20)-methyltransferase [Bacillota bacterium]|nr:precorrin-2 C(20)-methyltransferase [Bacillota bacterium]
MSKLFGIGIGPGDPELITVKAQQALALSDVVFVPQSKTDRDSVAYQIIKGYLSEGAEVVTLLLPMTKDEKVLEEAWCEAAKKIVATLTDDKTGAFVTLGDCMLYSTYTYVLKQIREIDAAMTIENIPGVTSFSAAASTLNIPLAEGEENLVIIPALACVEQLPQILSLHENIVFLKVAPQIDALVAALTEMGLEHNAVFISKCGHPDQEIIYNINSLLEKKLEYLSLMIVKKGEITR